MDWAKHLRENRKHTLRDIIAGADARSQEPTTHRIKEIRRQIRLTQKQFADALGVPLRTLQGWERGRAVPKPVFLLAECLRDFQGVRLKLMGHLRPRWSR